MKGRLALLAGIAVVASTAVAAPASADTAPVLACGSTITTSCSETAQFSDIDAWETPIGVNGSGCPAYLVDDYALLVGTGRGVEHDNINKAGDFWATTTFTGDVTITLYDPANVDVTVIDDQGDVAAIPTGPADATLSGHLTQWFGVSDNKQTEVFDVTVSFTGTDQDGHSISLHSAQHANWTPGSVPFQDPPRSSRNTVNC